MKENIIMGISIYGSYYDSTSNIVAPGYMFLTVTDTAVNMVETNDAAAVALGSCIDLWLPGPQF